MKSNPVPLIIVTLLVVGGVYLFISSGSGDQPALTSSNTENVAQTQFQVLVSELQPISFNTAIFSDTNFTTLVDITTPVMPEAPGRLDPFAPISGVTTK